MASGDATAIPVKNQAYRCVFPIVDADGDLVTGATGLDSEVSKDQGTFADATSEATEIATSSGIYYLDLTATEMNADCVAVIVKTTSSGAKTTVLVFYPQEAGDINVDVTYWNGTAVATPTTGGVPEVDVTHWLGTAAATPTVAGVPEVDLTHVAGATTNVAALATNVDAILTDTSTTLDNLVDDLESRLGTPSDLGTGATLAANMSDLYSVEGDAATSLLVLVNSMKGLTGFGQSTIGGTGNDTTHIHLSGMTYGDDEINNHLLVIYDVSTDEYHARWITDWVLSTELATVATLPFTPQASTDKYWILSLRNDVTASGDSSGVTTLLSRLGTPSDLGGGATVAANLADIEGFADSIPTDVWANGTRTLTAIDEDSTTLDLDATIRAAVGMASANLDTQLATIDTNVDDIETAVITNAAGVDIAADIIAIKAETAAILDDTDDIGVAGAGLTALATQASVNTIDDLLDTEIGALTTELAKVPKSDSTVTWNATALASINTQADLALTDYDPPTRAEATSDANSILAAVDAVDNFVDTEIGALTTAVADLPTNAELATALGTADDAVLAAIAALNNLSSSAAATAVLTTAMTESYAADGVAPTLAQAIFLIQQVLTEFAIASTTVTIKKIDGSTTAATLTLDSATTPTSATRAT